MIVGTLLLCALITFGSPLFGENSLSIVIHLDRHLLLIHGYTYSVISAITTA